MIKRIVGITALIGALFFVFSYEHQISYHISNFTDEVKKPFEMAKFVAEPAEAHILMPVERIKKQQIADTWGAPRDTDRTHEGQDIFAKKGTPILSATEGYIVRIGENTLGGKTVSVLGRGGYRYYYAHLDNYAPELSVGQKVSTTTIIGFVGNTGNAAKTPAHLHFGIYTPKGPINPLTLLTDRT